MDGEDVKQRSVSAYPGCGRRTCLRRPSSRIEHDLLEVRITE
jgi:hypothetical protein